MSGSSEISPGIKSDTYVYLSRGPNYTVITDSSGNLQNESEVTNSYTGGNITLMVNDWEHMPSPSYSVTLIPL
jgi:hypothetical protein